jgi:hypothetical protein
MHFGVQRVAPAVPLWRASHLINMDPWRVVGGILLAGFAVIGGFAAIFWPNR